MPSVTGHPDPDTRGGPAGHAAEGHPTPGGLVVGALRWSATIGSPLRPYLPSRIPNGECLLVAVGHSKAAVPLSANSGHKASINWPPVRVSAIEYWRVNV